MEEGGFPTFRLLQPELMTNDELVEILQRYKLRLNYGQADRDELLEVYKRLALPLPQRTYGSTWRERLLNKKQNKKKISIGNGSTCAPASTRTSGTSAFDTLGNRNPRVDRLKPPPDPTANASKQNKNKTIKLSKSPKKQDEVSTPETRKAEPEKETKSSEDDEEKNSKRKRIKIDFSDSSERSTPLPKVVGPKRSSGDETPSRSASKHQKIVF